MLKLYYTGAPNNNREQQRAATESLGGFISATAIPNANLNNLFSAITPSLIENKQFYKEVRVIAIKNETGQVAENVEIWFDYPTKQIQLEDGTFQTVQTNYAQFEIAAIAPNVNDCGDYFVERLDSPNSIPYTVSEFHTLNGKKDSAGLGNIPNGEYVVLFIKRTLTNNAKFESCEEIEERFDNGEELDLLEEISLKMEYNEDESISGSISYSFSYS